MTPPPYIRRLQSLANLSLVLTRSGAGDVDHGDRPSGGRSNTMRSDGEQAPVDPAHSGESTWQSRGGRPAGARCVRR